MFAIKNFKIIVFSIFLVFLSSQGKSEIKVAFIEMNFLVNESLAGKSLSKKLNIIDKANIKKLKEAKEKLDNEKNDISQKKNVLSNEEYEKKVIALNIKFSSLQSDAKKKIESLQSKRNIGMSKILKELNIILSEYYTKNQLTFIIDQKNIIIGKTDLNITNEILKLLNQKISK